MSESVVTERAPIYQFAEAIVDRDKKGALRDVYPFPTKERALSYAIRQRKAGYTVRCGYREVRFDGAVLLLYVVVTRMPHPYDAVRRAQHAGHKEHK